MDNHIVVGSVIMFRLYVLLFKNASYPLIDSSRLNFLNHPQKRRNVFGRWRGCSRKPLAHCDHQYLFSLWYKIIFFQQRMTGKILQLGPFYYSSIFTLSPPLLGVGHANQILPRFNRVWERGLVAWLLKPSIPPAWMGFKVDSLSWSTVIFYRGNDPLSLPGVGFKIQNWLWWYIEEP